MAEDAAFRSEFAKVKRANKMRLARVAAQRHNLHVNPHSLFDVQIKRIREHAQQIWVRKVAPKRKKSGDE